MNATIINAFTIANKTFNTLEKKVEKSVHSIINISFPQDYNIAKRYNLLLLITVKNSPD